MIRRAAAATAFALAVVVGSGTGLPVAPPRAPYVFSAPVMVSRERACRR